MYAEKIRWFGWEKRNQPVSTPRALPGGKDFIYARDFNKKFGVSAARKIKIYRR